MLEKERYSIILISLSAYLCTQISQPNYTYFGFSLYNNKIVISQKKKQQNREIKFNSYKNVKFCFHEYKIKFLHFMYLPNAHLIVCRTFTHPKKKFTEKSDLKNGNILYGDCSESLVNRKPHVQ